MLVNDCTVPLILGFLLDQMLGDPPGWPHPVRAIGAMIAFLERLLRRHFPDTFAGVLLVVLTTFFVGGGIAILAAWANPPWLRLMVLTLLFYYGLAARSLARETSSVLAACDRQDWPAARSHLSRIVGRDTEDLEPEAIYRACIETVAENTSDGVVAPLFWAAIFGPVGLWVYKTINTLDSMVGYRNEEYRRFGWAAARLDDLANYLPARLSWLLLAVAALVTRNNGRKALSIGWRDGRKHPSPNAAWPEAAMAGALGVKLGGRCTYGGVPSEKAFLGDGEYPSSLAKARHAVRLMLVTSWLALLITVAALVLKQSILKGVEFEWPADLARLHVPPCEVDHAHQRHQAGESDRPQGHLAEVFKAIVTAQDIGQENGDIPNCSGKQTAKTIRNVPFSFLFSTAFRNRQTTRFAHTLSPATGRIGYCPAAALFPGPACRQEVLSSLG